MNALVGYTGFVGSNLYEKGNFDKVYNSKNIEDAYGLKPDFLVYAGLRAEKYLANNDPDKDMLLIEEAKKNIMNIAPKKLVLISTVDIYKKPFGITEESNIETVGLHAYGYNRYILEQWVRENFPDALIIRLPGLFGKNIKKNFIYDYINVVPFMLKQEKFMELSEKEPILKDYYELQNNGFYKCRDISQVDKEALKDVFHQIGFSALNFTDSRSIFQFYPLGRLWNDIQVAIKNGILLWNPATKPVSASEVYQYLTGNEFVNELAGTPAYYDYKTEYAEIFGGCDGYVMNKEQILYEIKVFTGGDLVI